MKIDFELMLLLTVGLILTSVVDPDLMGSEPDPDPNNCFGAERLRMQIVSR